MQEVVLHTDPHIPEGGLPAQVQQREGGMPIWGNSCSLDEYKPFAAMVVVQFIYAAMAISAKAAFQEGFDSMVFVVYRQAIASLVLAPSALLAKRGNLREMGMTSMGAFGLVFVAALVGATLNQYFYYEGLDLASSSTATAMTNLIPAITFVISASIGFEKVTWNLRSMAKVVGTVICVGGAICIAFYKGPAVVNAAKLQKLIVTSFTRLASSTWSWVKGGLFLMGSNCCWSFWLVLQVPICKHYMDPLSLSTWMCLIATVQSALLTFMFHPDLNTWKITSLFELLCCVFAGIFGSGVTFYLQSWSISVRGPLFSALFNPLATIITTIFDAFILHDKLYVGSLIGAGAAVGGLYIVLWGKTKELDHKKSGSQTRLDPEEIDVAEINVAISVYERTQSESEIDVTKPLIDRVLDDV